LLTTSDFGTYRLRTDRWRLIHYVAGSEELYDHQADPHGWHNLAGEAAHTPTRQRLQKWLTTSPAPRLGPAKAEEG